MVLGSDEDVEEEHLINVQGPNKVYHESLFNGWNTENQETSTLNLGREIRDDSLRLNSYTPDNSDSTLVEIKNKNPWMSVIAKELVN